MKANSLTDHSTSVSKSKSLGSYLYPLKNYKRPRVKQVTRVRYFFCGVLHFAQSVIIIGLQVISIERRNTLICGSNKWKSEAVWVCRA